MALHRLTSIIVGVPNVAETAAYYADFGLTATGGGLLQALTEASSYGSFTPRPGAWSS